jgi:hypothetical protein
LQDALASISTERHSPNILRFSSFSGELEV